MINDLNDDKNVYRIPYVNNGDNKVYPTMLSGAFNQLLLTALLSYVMQQTLILKYTFLTSLIEHDSKRIFLI